MCEVPGDSLGPDESLGDDHRGGGLPPIALRLHPLKTDKNTQQVDANLNMISPLPVCNVCLYTVCNKRSY